MKKPAIGGVVSSLVFAIGCNDAAGPADEAMTTEPSATQEVSDHPPQVLFDPDTGRMTIVSRELGDAIRNELGIAEGEADASEATLIFRSRPDATMASLADDGPEDILNIRC